MLLIYTINSPVVSEEDVISLIMKCNRSSTFELWIDVEERGKHASNCLPEASREVVDYHLRPVGAHFSPVFL